MAISSTILGSIGGGGEVRVEKIANTGGKTQNLITLPEGWSAAIAYSDGSPECDMTAGGDGF